MRLPCQRISPGPRSTSATPQVLTLHAASHGTSSQMPSDPLGLQGQGARASRPQRAQRVDSQGHHPLEDSSLQAVLHRHGDLVGTRLRCACCGLGLL